MNQIAKLAGLACLSAAVLVGCDKNRDHGDTHTHKGHAEPMNQQAGEVRTAVANLAPSKAATTQPTLNRVAGIVTFTQIGDEVKVVADVTGLKPNSEHGFHIHESGDLSAPDLSSAGAHFNPGGHKHGGPDSSQVHAGDLGNLKADANGNAHLEITSKLITLGEGANSVVSKSVIVHAGPDDLKTDPSGNSGGRIAGGVIEAK
jgi:Cu-Zn family superoxide dismutase